MNRIVPREIAHWQVDDLPVAQRLRLALEELGIGCLGELNGLSRKRLGQVAAPGSPLARELKEVLTRARKGKIGRVRAAPAFRAEFLFVPQRFRERTFCSMDGELSSRLRKMLREHEFGLLGDLHGVPVAEIRGYRSCGRKLVDELLWLVARFQALAPEEVPSVPEAEAEPEPAPEVEEFFAVGEKAKELRPEEVPVSVRLGRVLRERGVRRLGDLEGVRLVELLEAKGCGTGTLEELRGLLARASAGQFEVRAGDRELLSPWHLLKHLDVLVAQVPERSYGYLLLRYQGVRMCTLEEIGGTGVTRERVRQMLGKARGMVLSQGGPRFRARLARLAGMLEEAVCPLTPALVGVWRSSQRAFLRHSDLFYARFLGELEPGIRAWPNGQVPDAQCGERPARIGAAAEGVVRRSPGGRVLLRDCFGAVRGCEGLKGLGVCEFLEALKVSRRLEVVFGDPNRPEVGLRGVGG